MTAVFGAGDQCLLIDGKKRRFLLRLREGGAFHSHHGVIDHDALIGMEDGSRVTSTGGAEFIALHPRLSDYVLKMKRGAQVVYPKDLGPILVYADIAPGSVVLEAGTGSGALTLGLLRAVGPTGRVVSVERREDHAEHAVQTITRWLGEIPDNLELRVGEVEQHIADVRPDRIVLDVPEPWHTATAAVDGLRGGGVFCAYVPTVPQLQQTVEALRSSGTYECKADRCDQITKWSGTRGSFVSPARLPQVPKQDRSPKTPVSNQLRLMRLRLNEDALTGALFSRLDGHVFLTLRHDGDAVRALRVVLRFSEDLLTFPDVGEPVIKHHEYVRSDLFTKTVSRAQILIDPHLHLELLVRISESPS